MTHQQDCHRSAQAYKSNDSSSSLRYVHELRVDRIAARDVLQSSYQIVRPLHQTDRLTLRRTGVTQAGSRSARPNTARRTPNSWLAAAVPPRLLDAAARD